MRKVGRTTDGASEFTVRLVPDNHGVLLRRTLDYAFANQRAEVYVAEAEAESPQAYEFAGVWYLAGSNTYYHSFPQAELDPSEPRVLVSDRRLRDDEFIIPQRLTRGRRSIRLRIVLTPVRTPLLPGRPVQHPAWSEIAYNVYCWTMPAFWGPEPATADK
jgi:hypothetical protein